MAEMIPRVFTPRTTRAEVDAAFRRASLLSGEEAETAQEKAEDLQNLLTGERGEEIVFHALEKMPDDWVIFHSVKVFDAPTKTAENAHELDFVLLIPDMGLLCLEVKNWSSGTVMSKASSTRKKDAPHEQAHLAKKTLVGWLEKRGIVIEWLEHRSAVVMLNAYSEEQKADSLYLCGRAAVLEPARLQSFLISQFVSGTGLRQTELRAIRGILTAAEVYKISLDDYLSRLNRAIAPLEKMLPMLEESEGDIAVMGSAGTGKTVMATREAARLAAAGKNVLFLCFNKNLVLWVRQDTAVAEAIASGRLTVTNFHGLCTDILGKAFYQWTLPEPDAMAVAEALDRKYDAIIVDEAQDFAPQWWEVTEFALKDKGRWYLFYDEKQVLQQGTKLRPTPTRIRLRTNLRNSAQIAAYGAAILGQPTPESLGLRGMKVDVRAAIADPKARAAEVQSIIDSLLDGNISSVFAPKRHQIVVLSPWRATNNKSCAPYLSKLNIPTEASRTAPDAAAARYRDTLFNPKSKEILYETIKAFKGLESDFVILTDVRTPSNDPSRGFTTADFYVAATRARYGLFVVPME